MDPCIENDLDKETQDDVFETNDSEQNGSDSAKFSPTHVYSREQLFELGELPLSKNFPEHLSVDYQNEEGIWDPEIWHRLSYRERKSSAADNEKDMFPPMRRFVDPKERLKEESRDGIVLSPQRKSFMTGCFVGGSGQSQGRGRDNSESDNRERENDRDRREARDLPQRRIGSGRLTIERDRYDERREDRRFEDHRGHDNRRDDWRRDNRGHDDRHRREEWTDYNGHNRHDRIRRRSNHHMSESEPEWFTAGPNSQSDTIELRGFNENKEEKSKSVVREDSESVNSPVISEPPPAPSPKSDQASTPSEQSAKVAPSPGADFDINELFNMDISGIRGGPSPVEGEVAASGSRFSRWFQNESLNETASGQPTSRVNMDYDPIEDLLATQPRRSMSDMFGMTPNQEPRMPPGQPMMGPVINQETPPQMERPQSPSRHHMEANLKAMLLANQNPVPMETRPPVGIPGNRFTTVSDLEAGLQHQHEPPNMGMNHSLSQHRAPEPQQPSDMSAFNKLVGMMKMSGSLPDSKRESPTVDLLVAKLEQQQKQQLQQQLQAKLLQHQETMARQNPTIITKPASPVPPMIGVPPNISQTTPRMVSPNPIIQQQHLLGQASTPRAPSPIMFGQQPPLHLNAPSPVHPNSHGGSSQNLSVNSLQVNSGSHSPVLARVPSPQELVYHTQAIMQNALIKKQLEDQKERFIKKQQRDRSPSEMTMAGQLIMPQAIMAQAGVPLSMGPGGPMTMPPMNVPPPSTAPAKTTTAFTPTSVIKKMAVERSNSRDKLKSDSGPMADVGEDPGSRSQSMSDMPAVSDPSRVMAVPPMPQQDVRIRRALVGSGSMKALQQAQQLQQQQQQMNSATSQQQQQAQMAQNRAAKQMYQGPAGLTPMPTAIPRLSAPLAHDKPAKSPLLARKGPQAPPPMGYNMPLNLMAAGPRHNMPPNNAMMHLQALQQQQQGNQNTARVAPMNHPALNQMNHLHALQPMDPRRGYYPGHGPPRMNIPGLGMHRSLSPQPMMNAGPRSPIPPQNDNDLSKWFGMDMLKQQLPNMPPLPAQGQRVLTVDELERRQQVVS